MAYTLATTGETERGVLMSNRDSFTGKAQKHQMIRYGHGVEACAERLEARPCREDTQKIGDREPDIAGKSTQNTKERSQTWC